MSDVNWYRSCRGVRTGAHSLTTTESRTWLLRKRSHIRCNEQKCDLDIRTVHPRFIWLKNRGETIRLYLVCSWPGRKLKKRRWLRGTIQLFLITVGVGLLCAAVILFAAWSSGVFR